MAADVPAMLDIGLIGAACAKRFEVRLPGGHTEPVNPWILVSLDSGERKSSTYRESIGVLREWEAAKVQEKRRAIAIYQSNLRVARKTLQRQEDALARDGDDTAGQEVVRRQAEHLAVLEQSPVVAPRLIVDDITPEKLSDVLAEQGGRILIASPEGGTFDLISGRYSPNQSMPNLNTYLMGYTGDDNPVDRIGREAKSVPKPLISMALATQPEVLRGLAKRPGFRGRGIVGRFWYSIPKGLAGFRTAEAPPIPDTVRQERRIVLGTLLNGEAPSVPYTLELEPQALGGLGRPHERRNGASRWDPAPHGARTRAAAVGAADRRGHGPWRVEDHGRLPHAPRHRGRCDDGSVRGGRACDRDPLVDPTEPEERVLEERPAPRHATAGRATG